MEAIPEPTGDARVQATITIAKTQATLLSTGLLTGDTLGTVRDTNAKIGAILGPTHPAVIILKKMTAIAAAISEGRPEPTDEELRAIESGGAPRSSGCFLATAALGTDEADDVVRLREFRDRVLRRSAAGRAFIAVYQRLSPPMAAVVARSLILRCLVRWTIVLPARVLADVAMGR
jgi:hypothetical protein